MPKLPPLSAREVCSILQQHGFLIVRQKGSHIILRKQLADRGITVPVPNHSEIARGTLKALSSKAKSLVRNFKSEDFRENEKRRRKTVRRRFEFIRTFS